MRKVLMVAAAAAIALVGLSANMCEGDKDKAATEPSEAPADAPAAAPEEPAAPDEPAQ